MKEYFLIQPIGNQENKENNVLKCIFHHDDICLKTQVHIEIELKGIFALKK